MTIAEILAVKLGTRLSKFLLKTYLKEPAEAVGTDLVDIAKGKIEGYLDRQEAKRQFERIGERIAAQLQPFFQSETLPQEVNAEAVIDQLARALDGNVSAELILARDLDPGKLLAELRQRHSLPQGQFSEAEVELYDRSLAEAVRYIVEIAAKLPRFEVTQVRESLQRLSRIEDVVGETAKGVRRIEEWVAHQEGDAESQQYEIDYRLAVGRNLDYLELFGADLTPESRRQALSVAYVSLTLETAASSGDVETLPCPVETLLEDLAYGTGRLMIRGEAGCGKSTLFRWAAIQSALAKLTYQRHLWIDPFTRRPEQSGAGTRFDEPTQTRRKRVRIPLPDGRQHWRQKVPFLLRLRDCKGGRLPSPREFPALIANEIESPPASWVRSILQAGRGLLLFDGIDEIPDPHREKVRREIKAIVEAYPKNFFLVSTRPEAVPADWLGPLGFYEARVNPMSDLDRSRFIDKWHEAVGIELARMGRSAADLPGLAEELKRQLPENPAVARLATNPLLCAMICALHRDRGQKLPESQSDLCESLCEVLLHRRERESGLDLSEFPEPYSRLKYPQKRIIVQEIAQSMVLNGESSITAERAQEKVAEALRSLAGQTPEDTDVVCKALVERSGMLRENKPGHLDFIHNTFKEYLAGDSFANSGDAGLLAEHAFDPAWQRVVLFAVATRRRGFAEEVIRRLLDPAVAASRPDRHLLRARRLLALQCRASALLVAPELEAELDEIARAMFPPRNMGDAAALAASGDMAVTFLSYRKELSADEAAASVRTLRLIGTPRARNLLQGYLDDQREVVIAELCQAVDPLSVKVIQERLITGVSLSEGVRSQISDLSRLSNLNGLRELDLSHTRVSDVSSLSGLKDLKVLNLSGTEISSISALSAMRELQVLLLSGTKISDVSGLSGLNSLQVLDLAGTQVSDVSVLSSLSGLQRICLREAPVSDVSPLSRLGGLQALDLSQTKISSVSALSELRDLQWVNLSCTRVSNVSALSNLENLQWLDLSGTRVLDVSPLSSLSRLERLYLNGIQLSGLSILSSIPGLTISVVGVNQSPGPPFGPAPDRRRPPEPPPLR